MKRTPQILNRLSHAIKHRFQNNVNPCKRLTRGRQHTHTPHWLPNLIVCFLAEAFLCMLRTNRVIEQLEFSKRFPGFSTRLNGVA